MNKETAKTILHRYIKNEESNLHAENYLLLAEAFGDAKAVDYAKININFIQRNNYLNSALNNIAYSWCNHYYYELVELSK